MLPAPLQLMGNIQLSGSPQAEGEQLRLSDGQLYVDTEILYVTAVERENVTYPGAVCGFVTEEVDTVWRCEGTHRTAE